MAAGSAEGGAAGKEERAGRAESREPAAAAAQGAAFKNKRDEGEHLTHGATLCNLMSYTSQIKVFSME